MPKKQTGTNPWDRIDAIRVAAGLVGDDVPLGAFTAAEYRKHYGLKVTTAGGELAARVEDGTLKTGRAYREDSRGRRVLHSVYWPAEEACD